MIGSTYEWNKVLTGLTYDEYHNYAKEVGAIRSSHIRPMLESPREYRYHIDNPRKSTDALRVGKIVHSIFENRERFMDTYVVEPEFIGKTKDGRDSKLSSEAKEMKRKWFEELPATAIVIKDKDLPMIQGIARTVKENKVIQGILKNAINESSVFTTCPETGLRLASRPDIIGSSGHVFDFKTSIDVSYDYFMRQIFSKTRTSFFYILNAAHYAYTMKCAGIGSGESFTFIAIKKTTWDAVIYPMDIGCLAVGEAFRSLAMRRIAKCMKTNEWPGYTDAESLRSVLVPEWAPSPDLEAPEQRDYEQYNIDDDDQEDREEG